MSKAPLVEKQPHSGRRGPVQVRGFTEMIGSALLTGILTCAFICASLWIINQLRLYLPFALLGGFIVTLLTFRSEWSARQAEASAKAAYRPRKHKPSSARPSFREDPVGRFKPTSKRFGTSEAPRTRASAGSPAPVNSSSSGGPSTGPISQPVMRPDRSSRPEPRPDVGGDTNFSGELNDHAGRLKTSTASLALNLKLYRLEGQPIEKLGTFQERVQSMSLELRDSETIFRLLHRKWCEPVMDRLLLVEQRGNLEKTSGELTLFFAMSAGHASVMARALAFAWIYRNDDSREMRRHFEEDGFDETVQAFRSFTKTGSRAS